MPGLNVTGPYKSATSSSIGCSKGSSSTLGKDTLLALDTAHVSHSQASKSLGTHVSGILDVAITS